MTKSKLPKVVWVMDEVELCGRRQNDPNNFKQQRKRELNRRDAMWEAVLYHIANWQMTKTNPLRRDG